MVYGEQKYIMKIINVEVGNAIISQKITRTSLPASKALQNALYRKSSWFTVESPGIKPDCKIVKI